MMISYMLSALLFFGIVQEPCPILTVAELVETADLVAVVKLNERDADIFEGSGKVILDAKRVFKGRTTGDLFTSNTVHVIKKDTEYLIFAEHIGEDQYDESYSLDKCATVVELGKPTPDLIDYLEERWVTKCYSKELQDKMTGANTRELQPFCGCDGKTYENFGHLLGSGITQYYPGDCKE